MVARAAARMMAFDGRWWEAGRHDCGGVLSADNFRHYVVQNRRQTMQSSDRTRETGSDGAID